MAPEILPASADPLEFDTTLVETHEDSYVVSGVTGPRANVNDYIRQRWFLGSGANFSFPELPGRVYELVSTETKLEKGRGNGTVNYRLKAVDDSDGLQELYGVDVVRDIYAAPYFDELTDAEILEVRAAFEAREDFEGTAMQNSLFRHLTHGQEQYIETYYELRLTWNTNSKRNLQVSAEDPNTVQPLPTLKPALQNLIDGLPTGEWLKKPAGVTSSGRQGWRVTLVYQWAKEWSVIYGGTFGAQPA